MKTQKYNWENESKKLLKIYEDLDKKTKCDFSFEHYEEILRLAKRKYKFSSFLERPDNEANRIYLRHDIDLALDKALLLAKIEHKNKVTATYFLQIDSAFYNPFNKESLEIVKEILPLGHHLGLHFNKEICQFSKRSINEEIKIQLNILKHFFPVKNVVSFHRPSLEILNQKIDSGKIISTYEPDFFQKIKYLSDSGGNWREGCPCEILAQGKYSNIQILTHPIWWGRNSKNTTEILREYLKQKVKDLDNYLVKNIKTYHSNFNKSENKKT